MKYYFTVFLFLFITVPTFSQEPLEYCGTQPGYTNIDTTLVPWYGDNAILYEYLEQHKYLFQGTDRVEERNSDPCASEIRNPFSIPIRFFVWLASNETPAVVSASTLNSYIDGVNEGFTSNGFNTNFYMYCPIYITNDDLVDVENDLDTYLLTTGGNNDGFAINVHIIRTSPGWTGLYNGFSDNITIPRTSTVVTLIHEIGHYFELEHTHRFTENPGCCKREPVTRGKKWAQTCLSCLYTNIPVNNYRCSRTGDYLCDTEADPTGSWNSNTCVFTGTQTDAYGETFRPHIRNYMSYYGSCRNRFSEQQKGIIAGAIRYWMYTVDDAVLDPDKYEPDDPYATIMGTTKVISNGESQCHSMHNSLVEQSCDDSEDWLKIKNENGFIGTYIVSIEDVLNETNPVSEVKIWNTNSSEERTTEIPTTSSLSSGIRTWSFDCSSIAPNTTTDFLIQIIKGTSFNDGGIYKVSLNTSIIQPEISGTNQICIGQSYKLLNLPTGASVSWESNPNISYITIINGGSVTINSISLPVQDSWIRAHVSLGACNYKVIRFFNTVGSTLTPIQNITWNQDAEDCYPIFSFSIPPVLGATSYVWTCESPNPDFRGCTSNGNTAEGYALHLQEGEVCPITVTVKAMDDCGNFVEKELTINYIATDCFNFGDNGEFDIRISPNPVRTAEMSIEIIDNSVTALEYQILISNQFGETKFISEIHEKLNIFNTYFLSEGLYFVHVVSDNNVVSKSFIVQNN